MPPSPASKHNTYRKMGVQTADPGRILLMLYDGCIKFCHQAKERIGARDMEGKGKRINEAQAILFELVAALRPDHAPELASNLAGLYHFMIEELTTANAQRDVARIDGVIALLEELRAAWSHAIQQQQQGTQAVQP